MAARIIRITMFKIPSKGDVAKALEFYDTLSKTAVKDGAPYILSLAAGPALEDARSQGYTLVAKSEFKSLDDMRYYDDKCEAHQTFKVKAKNLGVDGVMTVYYGPEVVVGQGL